MTATAVRTRTPEITDPAEYRRALVFWANKAGKRANGRCTCGKLLRTIIDDLGVEAPMRAGMTPQQAAGFLPAHCDHRVPTTGLTRNSTRIEDL